ncbi:MAG: zinc-ribbon domain-containing protein [Candidatus Longimicrobiales bacterium M2_2A_002]
MNIACPECSTLYRIDPDRVPAGGVATSCRECGTRFRVDDTLGRMAPGDFVTAPRLDEPERPAVHETSEQEEAGTEDAGGAESEGGAEPAPAFGPQDPDTRARRLARALVSDIKVYHPDRWEEAVAEGTLRADFRDEILKSWGEYVEQVGEEMAKKTPYFRDALNEILARGEHVF